MVVIRPRSALAVRSEGAAAPKSRTGITRPTSAASQRSGGGRAQCLTPSQSSLTGGSSPAKKSRPISAGFSRKGVGGGGSRHRPVSALARNMYPLQNPEERPGLVKEIFDLCQELGASAEMVGALQRTIAAADPSDLLMLRQCRDSLLQHRACTLNVLRRIDARERVVSCASQFLRSATNSSSTLNQSTASLTSGGGIAGLVSGNGLTASPTKVTNSLGQSATAAVTATFIQDSVAAQAQRVEVEAIYETLGQCTVSVENAIEEWEVSCQRVWNGAGMGSRGGSAAANSAMRRFHWRGIDYNEKMANDTLNLTSAKEAWMEENSPDRRLKRLSAEEAEQERQRKLQALEKTKKDISSRKIQTKFRAHRENLQNEYLVLRIRAAMVIQRFYKKIVLRQTAREQKRINELVALIQAGWRGVMGRRKARTAKIRSDAAKRIQVFWKAKNLRNLASVSIAVAKERGSAARVVQRAWRCAKFREKHFLKFKPRRAAIVIQRWFRNSRMVRAASAMWTAKGRAGSGMVSFFDQNQTTSSTSGTMSGQQSGALSTSPSAEHIPSLGGGMAGSMRGLTGALGAILSQSTRVHETHMRAEHDLMMRSPRPKGSSPRNSTSGGPSGSFFDGAWSTRSSPENGSPIPQRETVVWTPTGMVVVPVQESDETFHSKRRLVKRKPQHQPKEQDNSQGRGGSQQSQQSSAMKVLLKPSLSDSNDGHHPPPNAGLLSTLPPINAAADQENSVLGSAGAQQQEMSSTFGPPSSTAPKSHSNSNATPLRDGSSSSHVAPPMPQQITVHTAAVVGGGGGATPSVLSDISDLDRDQQQSDNNSLATTPNQRAYGGGRVTKAAIAKGLPGSVQAIPFPPEARRIVVPTKVSKEKGKPWYYDSQTQKPGHPGGRGFVGTHPPPNANKNGTASVGNNFISSSDSDSFHKSPGDAIIRAASFNLQKETRTANLMESNFWAGDAGAATIIQRFYRRYSARLAAIQRKKEKVIREMERSRHNAMVKRAVVVQCYIRCLLSRAYKLHLEKTRIFVAIRIQRWWRGLPKVDPHAHELDLDFAEVTKAQAVVLRRRKNAALRIAVWYHSQRQIKRRASTTISKNWRRFVVQRDYATKKAELAITDEDRLEIIREQRRQLLEKLRIEAITVVQVAVHKMLLIRAYQRLEAQRRAAEQLKMDQWSAAARIQRLFRRYSAKSVTFIKRRNRNERMRRQENVELSHETANTIQAFSRGCLSVSATATIVHRTEMERLNNAARVIQRALRLWKAKCDMLEKRVESTSMYHALRLARIRSEERQERRRARSEESSTTSPSPGRFAQNPTWLRYVADKRNTASPQQKTYF